MTYLEFTKQIGRLKETYGDKIYNDERLAILWHEVGSYSNEIWERAISELIASHQKAPLLPEIRKSIALQRERAYAHEKSRHTMESRRAVESNFFPKEEEAHIAATIQLRLQGRVSDSDWDQFMTLLRNAIPQELKCCEDGLKFLMENGYQVVYKCRCNLGKLRRESYSTY